MQNVLNKKKTINDVFQEFIEEQEKKNKPNTVRKYEEVLLYFKLSLDGYAYQYLDEKEEKEYEEKFNVIGDGDEPQQFCDIFGPDKILENVSEFTNYFMIRKVFVSKEVMRSVGRVIKKLGKWLFENRYVDCGEGLEIQKMGTESSVDLPGSEDFREMLFNYTEPCFAGEEGSIEGHFSVEAVQPGKLSLLPMSFDEKKIIIKVPKYVSSACKVGWTISGEVIKKEQRYVFTEVWNVYP